MITVYITNFNYQKYLKQSVESVLNQTTQDFELIIIDDGSTDNSREIIEQYRGHEKVTIIYQKNKGLNISNNVAMRVSNGKYIMRLDADDFLAETALEDMVSLLENDESLGLVFPDYFYVDENGVITGEARRHNFDKEVSLFDQPAHGACTMIRLEFLKKLGGYNESFTCQDGYDLWLKFVTYFKVTNINKPLFYYRKHGNNLTTNEENILKTRRLIKEAFVKKDVKKRENFVVIPARNTLIKGDSWPLYRVNGETILEMKVNTALNADSTNCVAVISSDEAILSNSRDSFNDDNRVLVVDRPSKLASYTETLDKSIDIAIEFAIEKGFTFKTVMTAALEFPFLSSEIFEEMIHTLYLFKTDSVLSVRPDNRMYYQHNGHTLTPILDQDKFVKVEREALYKSVGGLMLTSIESFKKYGTMKCGKIGHVLVEKKNAFGVFNEFDLEIYKLLIENDGNN